jgi:hypothetical protein
MRARARRLQRELRFCVQLVGLPRRVAWFQWRAWRLAHRIGDEFALVSGTRPRNLAILLQVAQGRRRTVELGTGSAWTTISLVLADPGRLVSTYDPVERPQRERYLGLVDRAVCDRVTFVTAEGRTGPRAPGEQVDLLYIDSSHDANDTIREVRAWQPALRPGALVVFDDYAHAEFPGVRDAVGDLQLSGEERGGLFVHEVDSSRAAV